MSLVSCRECHNQVSTEAVSCPRCGAPRPSLAEWKGTGFEWNSDATFLGYPLIHIATGRDAMGKRRVAKGVIAIGQYAVGGITIAQFGIGLVFGFGQFMLAPVAISQFAGTILFGAGQLAVGYIAIGQFAAGQTVLAQFGYGNSVWTPARQDPEAVAFFTQLLEQAKDIAGW